jgi:hypothetical protein
MQNIDTDLEGYKEAIESHFGKHDGYISTKLIYNYRMALYYEKIGDKLEADKCLAFVIANGKEHHMVARANERFRNSVNVEDYVYDYEAEQAKLEQAQIEQSQLLQAKTDPDDIEEVEVVNEDNESETIIDEEKEQ